MRKPKWMSGAEMLINLAMLYCGEGAPAWLQAHACATALLGCLGGD